MRMSVATTAATAATTVIAEMLSPPPSPITVVRGGRARDAGGAQQGERGQVLERHACTRRGRGASGVGCRWAGGGDRAHRRPIGWRALPPRLRPRGGLVLWHRPADRSTGAAGATARRDCGAAYRRGRYRDPFPAPAAAAATGGGAEHPGAVAGHPLCRGGGRIGRRGCCRAAARTGGGRRRRGSRRPCGPADAVAVGYLPRPWLCGRARRRAAPRHPPPDDRHHHRHHHYNRRLRRCCLGHHRRGGCAPRGALCVGRLPYRCGGGGRGGPPAGCGGLPRRRGRPVDALPRRPRCCSGCGGPRRPRAAAGGQRGRLCRAPCGFAGGGRRRRPRRRGGSLAGSRCG
ncbi:hypothetical protein I4F81_002319 [Pyropia yezoensis]|uniref:Uncharacterized protein n=1 Tax=Pyropia yezoensis TaxID=2788 RepID=A0ACC3BP17_PYRYE|nr:hypothetical protein I4F81_002319 [Neopyropia yezoensis]